MKIDIINQTIEEYLDSILSNTDYSGISQYTVEGVPVDSDPNPTSDIWLLIRISVHTTEKVEIKRQGVGIRYGNLYIVVNSPISLNGSKRIASQYAGYLERDLEDIIYSEINFLKPNTIFTTTDKWLKHTVKIPFYTEI